MDFLTHWLITMAGARYYLIPPPFPDKSTPCRMRIGVQESGLLGKRC